MYPPAPSFLDSIPIPPQSVILAVYYQKQWAFVHAQETGSYQCLHGMWEPDKESADKAVRRILLEKIQAPSYSVQNLCSYSITGDNGEEIRGACYLIQVDYVESAAPDVVFLDGAPAKWTYPDTHPSLFRRAQNFVQTQGFTIVSLREEPEYLEQAIAYFQEKWADEKNRMMYDDALRSSIPAKNFLPQWYLLLDGQTIIGCAGLISNDFISRGDLWPWLCALYVEPAYRGKGCGGKLIGKAVEDARRLGFTHLYLCTDLSGYYEQYGFSYLGIGYHPWGGQSKIYQGNL